MAEYIAASLAALQVISDANPAAIPVGSKGWVTTGDYIYEWDGDSWVLKSIAGAGLVRNRGAFLAGGTYETDLVMDGTAQIYNIPSGTETIMVYNKGATTEDLRVAWGGDSAAAEANLTIAAGAATTGIPIPPRADDPTNARTVLEVPAGMTVLALCNEVALDTQAVSVIPGKGK